MKWAPDQIGVGLSEMGQRTPAFVRLSSGSANMRTPTGQTAAMKSRKTRLARLRSNPTRPAIRI
jgi:hypothetical protein